MDLGLSRRTALVTGASYGLGFACARVLMQEGARVAIAARNSEKLASAAEVLRHEHEMIRTFACDLSVRKEVEALVPKVAEALGTIDILVVSTGHPAIESFSEATTESWQQGMDLILWPNIALAKAVIPGMRNRRFGRIVFIGSILGIEPEHSSVIQSTIRTGLNSLTKCIATENAEFGITANVVCPGYFQTPLVEKLAEKSASDNGSTTESVLEQWKHYSPMKTYGEPEDLGALVAFLASSRGKFITGTTITIDGGAVRQW